MNPRLMQTFPMFTASLPLGRRLAFLLGAVGALQFENIMARDAYVRHLRGLMDAGMGQRVMFGSDFPNMQRAGIEIIRQADFLSEAQKRDILCNNAARFFRLGAAICGG